jgi:hypothetical protein
MTDEEFIHFEGRLSAMKARLNEDPNAYCKHRDVVPLISLLLEMLATIQKFQKAILPD